MLNKSKNRFLSSVMAVIYMVSIMLTSMTSVVLAVAPTFTITPASCDQASFPKRITVTSNQNSFTPNSATPYILDSGVPESVTISNVTSTATTVAFTVGTGLSEDTYQIRIVDPLGTYNVGDFIVADPEITAVSPSSIANDYSEQLSIDITAENTNFVLGQSTAEILNSQGTVMAYVGGVTAVDSENELTFSLNTGLGAGTYSVRITTDDEVVVKENALVVRGVPSVAISPTSVNEGYALTTINVTGTNVKFENGVTTVAILDDEDEDTGKAGTTTVLSSTSLSFSLKTGLASGNYTIQIRTDGSGGEEIVTKAITVNAATCELKYQGNSFTGTSLGYSDRSLSLMGTNTSFASGNTSLYLYDANPDNPGSNNITATYISGVTVEDSDEISFTLKAGLTANEHYYVRAITGSQIVTTTFKVEVPTLNTVTLNSNIANGNNIPIGYDDIQIAVVGNKTLFKEATTVKIYNAGDVEQASKITRKSVTNSTNMSYYLEDGLTAGVYTIKIDIDGSAATTNDVLTHNVTVITPSIVSISPSTIINTSSTPITITLVAENTNFTEALPQINILGVDIEQISSVTVSSDTRLTFNITPDTIDDTGVYDISVSTNQAGVINQTITGGDLLTVGTSGITLSTYQVYADRLGVDSITVTGTGTSFDGDTIVTIDGEEVDGVNVVSSTQLNFVVPEDLTTGAKTLIADGNQTTFNVNTRSISVTPKTGKKFGYSAYDITLTGSGVTFNTTTNKPTITISGYGAVTLQDGNISTSTIVFAFPTGLAAGTYTITASFAGGTYNGVSVSDTVTIANKYSALYYKQDGQVKTSITVNQNASPFIVDVFGALIAGGADEEVTPAFTVTEVSDIVDINQAGQITVKSYGSATITASLDGKTTQLNVTVSPIIDSINVSNEDVLLDLDLNETETIAINAVMTNASIVPVAAANATWTVTEKARHDETLGDVVTVANGIITPVAAGTATVRASYQGKIKDISVVVKELDSVEIMPGTAQTVEVGDAINLAAKAVKTNADFTMVTNSAAWQSSNTNVAVVNSAGKVSAITEGTAIITVTYSGKTDTVNIIVEPSIEITAINITGTTAIKVAEISELTLTATTNEQTTIDITASAAWISSNQAVATVAQTGVVTALTAGTTIITASYNGQTDTVTITVTAPVEDNNNSGSGSSGSTKKTEEVVVKPTDTVQQISANIDAATAISADNASDILEDISDKEISKEDAKLIINKVVDKTENITTLLTENIAEILTSVSEVANVVVEESADTKIIRLSENEIKKALDEAEKLRSDILQGISQKVSDEVIKDMKEKIALTIKVDNITEKDKIEMPVSTSILGDLKQKGIGLKVETDEISVLMPADAINDESIELSKQIKLKAEILAETEENEIKEKANKTGYLFNGKIYSFAMDIEKNDGSTSAVDKFDSKLQIELKLSKEELANIKDKRKAGVYYIDENGNLEFMGGHFSETGIVFETGHFSNYTIVEYNKTFDDISTHWAKDYVEVVAARHIVNGMTETTFEPDTKLTRAQLATILGRTFEIKADQYQNRFKDVPQGEYYTDYVIKMSELGIIKGYEDGTFRPNDQVTREQLVVLMMRAYRYVSKDNTTINAQNTFSDMSEIADYAKSDVNLAKAMNMISGVGDNEFNPKGNSTRAETSKLIVELLKKLKKL